jgi:hypothetical protein
MSSHRIETVERLHEYLYAALQLEHATIPPYLTALYSLHPGTNSDAAHVIRVVAVEEMLHLTLAANLLNAVGGTVDLTRPDFVPTYPVYLPDGETDFQVSRLPFGKEALDSFISIERPREARADEAKVVQRTRPADQMLADPTGAEMQFFSIGEFYEEIHHGIDRLHAELGDALFSGDPARQVTPEYYYSGGGELVPVYDLASARAAVRLIAEQGEGLRGGIYDAEHELSHYYRFQQLQLGRYYQEGDTPGNPTGPELEVDWDAVYPALKDATIDDFPEGSEIRAAAIRFDRDYADFLGLLTRAYGGAPDLLIEAVVGMFRLRDGMLQLFRHPIPGREGVNGAPAFAIGAVTGAVAT